MKKVLIFLTILLLSGCSCKYELSINNTDVDERLKISDISEEIPFQADLVNFSSHDYEKVYDNGTLSYKTNYSLELLNNSDLFNCFSAYNIYSDNGIYTIRTSNDFKCLPYQYNDYDKINYNELEISISTNNKVLDHNSKKKIGNTYYWYINKDNINNAEIYIKFNTNRSNYGYLSLFIIISIILFIGIIIYKFLSKKTVESNKI